MSGMDVLLGDGVRANDLDWAAEVEGRGKVKWRPIRFAHRDSILVVPVLGGGLRGWLCPPIMS